MERWAYNQNRAGIGHIIDVIRSARPWLLRLRRNPSVPRVFLFSIIMVFMSLFFVSCNTYDPFEPDVPDEIVGVEEDDTDETSNTDEAYGIDETGGNDETDEDDNRPEGPNLLINGGLEEWTTYYYDMPSGWFCHNNNNVKKDWKVVCEGKCSARMKSFEKGSTATIDQRVPVKPGGKIRIRFYYYVEQWKINGARTYCYFRTESSEKYNIPNSELNALYDKATYYIIRGGGYGLSYLPHELRVWQKFEETIAVPPTAKYFVFGINSYYGTTLYVDDCYVIDEAQ